MNKMNELSFVVHNFKSLEQQLLECMEFIPYIESNMNTISHKFIPIILDSCSLIDSIFKMITKDIENTNFKKYAELHEKMLNLKNSISIFLVIPIKYFQPFKNWDIRVPEWWTAYNKIKHDRISNYHLATYKNTVESIIALHQLIVKCREFTNLIIKDGWFNPNAENTFELIIDRQMEYGVPITPIPCESQLIVSPFNINEIVSFKDGLPVFRDCEFSDKVRIMLEELE